MHAYTRIGETETFKIVTQGIEEAMKRIAQIAASLLILIMGVIRSYAQITLHSDVKSLLGIEVHFRFDNSQLDANYMDNARSLARFSHVVDSIGAHMIDSIIVVSQSSPEGSYAHNMRLSQRRANTMRLAIEHRHPELKELLRVHPDGESWMQLREFVKNDTVMHQEHIDEVLAIIDSKTDITTKKKSMQQHFVYNYLYLTYYPRIRNSVFCIIYYDLRVMVAQIDDLILPATTPSPFPTWIDPSVYPLQKNEHIEYKPLLNVRTNLLYDLGTVLNVGIEYYPRNPRWSMAGHYTFPWWSNDKKHQYLQILDWSLEARYYLQRKRYHTGWYAAPYVHWNLYDISIDAEYGWQGEGKGCGLSIGYTHYIGDSQRWKFEYFFRLGYYQTTFDPYHASNPYNDKYYYDWEWLPEEFIPRNHRLQMLGPTGAGITLSCDLFRRKLKIEN